MTDPFQLGTIGFILAGIIAAAKLIEWVNKSDLKAIAQSGRWGAVGLFVLSVPLLFGLLMNRRWIEAIGLSAVVLVAFAVYGPRLLGQLRPRRAATPDRNGPGGRPFADTTPDEAELVQRSIAVLEEYLRRKTGVAEQGASDLRASPSRITDGRSEEATDGRRQGDGNGAYLELPSPVISEAEALSILGLPPDAEVSQINDAHRRLMQIFHPDRRGSPYFAVKLNQAKDVLLALRAKSTTSTSAGPRKRSRRDSGQADPSRSKSKNGS
jgi:hypothetical protein